MDINLERYKVLYYVGKYKSISKAAGALYISQPAVSQAIRQLESRLGGSLFIRTPKGIVFTPEGEQLYREIEKSYELMRIAESRFLESTLLESGEIRIGASDMSLKFFLLPYLEQFHKRYPKIRIKVTNGPSPETVELLRAGFIDVGMVSLPLADKDGLDIHEALRLEDCFVAGSKFESLRGKELPLDALMQYPVMMLEKHTSTRRYVDDFFTSRGMVLEPEIELATSDLLIEFAKRNLGIACVVKDFAQSALDQGDLFEIKLDTPMTPRHYGIITLRHSPLTSSVRRLMGIMEQNNNT